jgi:unsaturated rhamnogalacturonyl hydrolase
MIIETLGILIFICLIIVLTMDLYPHISDWFLRIHIGRFDNIMNWNNAIRKQGVKWLLKTPKIKVTDNSRLVVIDRLKGNYSNSAIQHWQEGALVLGLSECFNNPEDSKAKEKVMKYLDTKLDQTGQWIHPPKLVDGAILAYAIMKLDFVDGTKYKPAFDTTWEMIKDHIGEDGTVMYRKFMKNYRYVDTIGFICPFLVLYGLKFNNPNCVSLAIKQIKEYEMYGMHKEHFIPSHAYALDGKLPLGLYGWGRGLGWFAIGLIDSWKELPPNHKYKEELEESVREFSKAIMKFQQDSGSWNWTVTRRECREDSSVTATLCWFLLNAAQLEGISNDCLVSSDKALKYLMKVTRRNGSVDFSQGDTKDIGVYSMNFNILPFTQGFCIRSINYYFKLLEQNIVRKVG